MIGYDTKKNLQRKLKMQLRICSWKVLMGGMESPAGCAGSTEIKLSNLCGIDNWFCRKVKEPCTCILNEHARYTSKRFLFFCWHIQFFVTLQILISIFLEV